MPVPWLKANISPAVGAARQARRYLEIGVAKLRQAAVIAYGLLSSKIGGSSVRVLNDFQRY
jgi:hypothetical protein